MRGLQVHRFAMILTACVSDKISARFQSLAFEVSAQELTRGAALLTQRDPGLSRRHIVKTARERGCYAGARKKTVIVWRCSKARAAAQRKKTGACSGSVVLLTELGGGMREARHLAVRCVAVDH